MSRRVVLLSCALIVAAHVVTFGSLLLVWAVETR